jgi:hypothetical protein
MGIFNFPSNFVYWEDVKNHDMIKPILLEKVKKFAEKYDTSRSDLVNASSSFLLENHFITDSDMIKHLVWDPINNAIRELNSKSNTPKINVKDSVILNSWYTLYDKNGFFNTHDHDGVGVVRGGEYYNASFSIIYILKNDNETNSTGFLQNKPEYGSVYTTTEQNIFSTADVNDIKEGSVLVFPSSLCHCVDPVKVPGRITIAINVASRFA